MQIVLALIVIFGRGWFVGGILNLPALVSSPLVSMVQCPAGSTATKKLKQLSFNQPGQETLTFQCADASGNPVTPLSDGESKAIENRIFYPAGVALTAVVVTIWFILSLVRGRTAATGSAAS
jgi:hypothetical protein